MNSDQASIKAHVCPFWKTSATGLVRLLIHDEQVASVNAKAVLVGLSWDIYYAHKNSSMLDDNQFFSYFKILFFYFGHVERSNPASASV